MGCAFPDPNSPPQNAPRPPESGGLALKIRPRSTKEPGAQSRSPRPSRSMPRSIQRFRQPSPPPKRPPRVRNGRRRFWLSSNVL